MNIIKKYIRIHSIQTRLIAVMTVMLAVALVVNLNIYSQINRMVRRIDSVFSSNVTIVNLTDTLEKIEENVFEYLNTKSSAALENYYRYSQDYRNLIDELNEKNVDNPILMLEKNIREMSESYLEKTDETVQAKRGRNVEKYKTAFEEETQLYRYINNYIYELNSRRFELNSENYKFLLSVMSVTEILAMVLILAVFGISALAIIMLVRAMIHPLVTLSETAQKVTEGNFEVEIPQIDSDDEIGIVTKTFDQMLTSIRAYIVRVRTGLETEARMKERELSMEAHLKEAQLKFLQAQINPHFLFNSLNAGAQLAMMEDADATGVFLEKMADFFRYNVKKTDGDSTLREEIELVDNYIYILNVRFAGDITYQKQIGENIPDITMPSMILQPLVENAVSHGIREDLAHGVITLSVEAVENALQILVTDNGIGMTKEQIAEVMGAGLSAPSRTAAGDTGTADEPVGTGIGLGNVINRLRLYYNQDNLLSIHSEGAGKGTEIMVILPILEEPLPRTADHPVMI